MKKFKKDFLSEVLGFNEEEVKITMEAQRKFPSFLTEEGEGFCVDGRTLWETLEVKQDFSDWIKKQIENSESIENIDFTSFPFKREDKNGWKSSIEYTFTLEIAKEIAMFAGANNRANIKLKANSKLVRKYFILMEKGIKGIQEHALIREPEKQNYNKMKEEIIKDYYTKQDAVTKLDEEYLMKRESNMINQNLMGFSASEIKVKLGYIDKQTREHLLIEQNKTINFLQLMIIGLVMGEIEFNERNKIIKNICDSKYSHLKMI